MTLAAPEHQEMNRQVEVTWRKLRTIVHSLMVHTRFLKACIHFALIYTTYHIFPVLPIKHLIKKHGNPTTPFKPATGKKPSLSHLRVLFCPYVVRKATAHVGERRHICVTKRKRVFAVSLLEFNSIKEGILCTY